MNEIQKHLVLMLQEIDEICTKNSIPYILAGRTAKDACQSHKFLGEYMYASVMMRGQDFDKFCRLVAKMEGRAIESIRENPDFPGGMAMRYVDETTTFIYGDSAHKYRHKGIFVTIQKCRNIPGNKYKAKLANGIEKAIAYADSTDISGLDRAERMVVKALRLAIKALGKARVINGLLDIQDRLTRSGSSTMAYVRPLKKNIDLPASMFTSVKRVELEGATFFVPSDTDKYLEKVYAKKWKDDKKPEGVSARHLLVTSTQVSYKEVDTDESLYANRAAINEMIEHRKNLAARIKSLSAQIEKYWDILFLTQERYRAYRLYKPVWGILNERLENREYGWLAIVLKDYLAVLKKYLAKGWPLTVCPELDRLAVEMLCHAGEYTTAQKFKKLKNEVALKAITMKLDERAAEQALLNLPATITVGEENVIPVFLRDGEALRSVAMLDEEGQTHPVLLKSGSNVVSAPLGMTLSCVDGVETISVWSLAVEQADGTYLPLFGSGWENTLFETAKAIPLVQHIYGRDLEIAWLAVDGHVYITGAFGSCNQYTSKEAPKCCTIKEDFEVPVGFIDEECGALRELFCVDQDGQRAPVVTLGEGGVFQIAPNAADALFFLNDEGNPERLSVDRFADEASGQVEEILNHEKKPQICCKLVQTDVFDRCLEIAALYDDEVVLPLARMNADGTLAQLPARKQTCTTLYLKLGDGTTTTLATIDADGKVVPGTPDRRALPVGVIITRPLVRNQMYVIGGSDGDLAIQTTGYAL